MKVVFKKIMNLLPYIILLVSFILIIQVATSIKKGNTPTIFGKAVFYVVSPSMEDTIMVGDIIFVNTNPKNIIVGDIITFKKPGEESILITHRIIKIEEVNGIKYYTTLGDNNFKSFDWETNFPETDIVGKYISKSGFFGGVYKTLFSNGLNILFVVIIFVFLIIGGMELSNIIKQLRIAREKQILEEKEKLIQAELMRLKKEKREKD